ncbi:helix-turn-helix domain-containing protein [Subtercola sp. YIM 133946]|uniref:helix-turn-helix domain-containing protein n=1 Tax=Subtercola sp. YIM 133946 TaxID=3118909 RepID=UPI002F927FDD
MNRFDVEETATYARRHPNTIRRLLESGELHGSQPRKGGRWLVKEECVDAYLDGVPCPHKQNVTSIGQKRGAA